MENASKALLIAGGMLIAMMILVMLVSLVTSISDVAESQDKKQLTQQIQEFNRGYEAYNKTKMFGIDVITVTNKAVDYNKTLDTDEEEYKINVILKLNQNFDRTKQEVIQYGNGSVVEGEFQVVQEGTLKSGTYQLFEREDSIKMNDDIISFLNQRPDDIVTKTNRTTVITTFTYSAITNFKTAIFSCTNVDYKDGRVSSMTFSQI